MSDCSPPGSCVHGCVGCHSLPQGIFLTQGSNPHLLDWQADSSPLSHLGSPHLSWSLLTSSQSDTRGLLSTRHVHPSLLGCAAHRLRGGRSWGLRPLFALADAQGSCLLSFSTGTRDHPLLSCRAGLLIHCGRAPRGPGRRCRYTRGWGYGGGGLGARAGVVIPSKEAHQGPHLSLPGRLPRMGRADRGRHFPGSPLMPVYVVHMV